MFSCQVFKQLTIKDTKFFEGTVEKVCISAMQNFRRKVTRCLRKVKEFNFLFVLLPKGPAGDE